jgi:tetratricopeptide (TPR) repeat protein
MNALRCGFLMWLITTLFGPLVAAEEPNRGKSDWVAQKLRRSGRTMAVDAGISLLAVENTIRRTGEAGRDLYLKGLNFIEIHTAAITQADVALGRVSPKQFLERAQARTESGQLAAALNDVNACLKLDPKNTEAWLLRGEIRVGQKQFLRAVRDFTQAIELQPLDSWAYQKRANCRLELGDKRGALDDAGEAIRLNRRAIHYFSRASIRRQAGDARGAFDDLDQAIELEPDVALYYEVRGWLHEKLGEFDAAIADCTSALELDPKMAGAYFVRGIAKSAKKDYAGADADFKAAHRLDPASFPLTEAPRELSSTAADDAPSEPPRDPQQAMQNKISELCKRAWRAATSPDERYRDGARAFETAYVACKLTEFKDWHCVEVLAAACAERGEFPDAVRYQTLAIRLRDEKDRSRLGQQSDKPYQALPDLDGSDRQQRLERLELYQNHRAYRDER